MSESQKEYENKHVEAMNKAFAEHKLPIVNPAQVTCVGCSLNRECTWAFDLYNTNGDCLALK